MSWTQFQFRLEYPNATYKDVIYSAYKMVDAQVLLENDLRLKFRNFVWVGCVCILGEEIIMRGDNKVIDRVEDMLMLLSKGDCSMREAALLLYDCWNQEEEEILSTCESVIASFEDTYGVE